MNSCILFQIIQRLSNVFILIFLLTYLLFLQPDFSSVCLLFLTARISHHHPVKISLYSSFFFLLIISTYIQSFWDETLVPIILDWLTVSMIYRSLVKCLRKKMRSPRKQPPHMHRTAPRPRSIPVYFATALQLEGFMEQRGKRKSYRILKLNIFTLKDCFLF